MTLQVDNPKKESWTVGELLDWTCGFLTQKGRVAPARRRGAAGPRARLPPYRSLHPLYRSRSADVRGRFRELIRQRVEGCPVAYLVGRKEFFSLTLEVAPAVLIPRPDSEFVVVECLRLAKELPEPAILDIGTGSGNLPVAIAQQHKKAPPDGRGHQRRRSGSRRPQRCEARGRRAHLLPARRPVYAGAGGTVFDFIVSNPPYIPHDDIAKLAVGVRDHEPHLALDGGADGYAVFDRLIVTPRLISSLAAI